MDDKIGIPTVDNGLDQDDPVLVRWLKPADSGDEEAQLAIGYHYMSLCNGENDDGSNMCRAISWLVKASRQGNLAATEQLKDCLGRNVGITEGNSEDVLWCITTTRFEKKAREAARQLFHRLRPLGLDVVSDSISSQDLSDGIAQLSADNKESVEKKEKKLLEKIGKIENYKAVSESDFIESVLRRLYGRGGGSSLFSTEGDWNAFHKMPWMKKCTRYPGMTMSWLLDAAVDTASSQGVMWLRTLFPVSQIYALVAVVIWSVISVDAILWILPLLVFYSGLITLLIVTAKMLRSRKRLGDIQTISGILAKFTDVSLDSESAVSSYSWQSIKPYATFFIVLPLCVSALSIADRAWIPCAEMMVLAGAAFVTCFLALNDRYDKLAVGSILIDVVFTCFVGVVKLMPPIPVLHSLVWYTVGPGFGLDLPIPGLQFMIGLPSLAFCAVPLIFVRMAASRSWRGTYQILVPHLVCFLWWRFAVLFFMKASWIGLARAVVGWAALIVVLPVMGIILIGYGVYILYYTVSLSSIIKFLTTVALIAGASAYAVWSRSGFQIGSTLKLFESRTPLYRAAILLVILLGSCIPFAVVFGPPANKIPEEHVLPWPTYHASCAQPGSSPVTCAHYAGARLAGSGKLASVSITRIENPAEGLTLWMPSYAADWLRCAYGTEYPADCESIVDSAAYREACHYNTRRQRRCHLRNLDRYTYEVFISLTDSDKTVRVVASSWFQKPASIIAIGQEVSFRARLSEAIGPQGITLGLYSVKCTTCGDVGGDGDDDAGLASMLYYSGSSWNLVESLHTMLRTVWNFYLHPLFVFV